MASRWLVYFLKRIRKHVLNCIPLKQICPYPFARMEIGREGFVPCCDSWLTPEYYQLESGSDPWNGPAAQELRRRVRKGDYRYCHRERCQVATSPLFELFFFRRLHREAPLTWKNFWAMAVGKVKMPEGPAAISVLADPRCNLSCPSCRPRLITKVDSGGAAQISRADEVMGQVRHNIRTIRMAGDGEVFFSPWLREKLKQCSPAFYPNLREVFVLTNGLFLNEKNLEELEPGSNWIKKIFISVDAGDEATYQRVRGGNWQVLLKNIEWAGKLFRQRRIRWLQLNAVVRKDNFRSMPALIKVAKELGVSSVRLAPFFHWGRAQFENYESEAIHLPNHPLHKEWTEISSQFYRDPIVFLQFPKAN